MSMPSFLTKAIIGGTLAATTLAVATPAEAQRYRYYDRYHRGNGGAAVAAGIAGLAIGAALVANTNDRYYRDRWYRDNGYRYDYDDYYYRSRGYYPNDGYYAYRYRDYQQCRTERRWDPYYGQRVRVRVCY